MRRGSTRGPHGAAVLLLLSLGAGVAAPAGAALQWYQSYEEGLEAVEHRDWAAALGHFQEAAQVRSEPAARVRTYGTRFLFDYDPLYQQARCLAELGRLEEARELLAESEAAGVTTPSALAALRERLESLAARRSGATGEAPSPPPEPEPPPREESPPADAVLAVRSTPAGATVLLDGRRAGTTPLPEVDASPGRHRLELRLAGRETWSEVVDLTPGERLRLDVTLAEAVRPEDRPAGGGAEDGTEPAPDRAPGEREAPPSEPAPATVAQPAGASATPATGGEAATGERLRAPAEVPPPPAGERGPRTPPDPRDPPSRSRWVPAGGALALALALVLVLALFAAGVAAFRLRRPGRLPARIRELPGRIGRYRVTGELGRGGMATTYRAARVRDGLPVAIKVPHETGDPTYLHRFLREGRLGETLHHPRIVRIVEAGEEAGRPFLALELIPGRTLRAALDDTGGTFPLRHALEVARDVAEALDYAHGKGVVHRDLKPENVMLLPDGTVKVMDFGVARVEGQPGLTTSSFFFGSPVYAAPELVDPPSIDHRADLYSLGVVLFELLEGSPPFHHESVFKLLEMHQRQPLPAPEALPHPLPEEVWLVLRRLLAKDPADRYPGAQELLVDLERLLYELPPGEGAGERTQSRQPRQLSLGS